MADKNETSRVIIDEDTPEISYVGKKPSDITVKVDVDISEALTGLKALQREAKKATQVLRELEEAPQLNLANIIANSLPISTEDAEKVVEAIMQGRHRNGHVFPVDKGVNQPIVVAPLTVGDVPSHVKQYGEGNQTYKATGHVDAWFNADLSNVPTTDLHSELINREGVEEYGVDAHGGYAKISISNYEGGNNFFVEGPARIVVNRD